MKSITAAASLFGLANAGDGGYNYATSNGADWGDLDIEGNVCSEPGGSPINVNTDKSLYVNYDVGLDNLQT